MKSNKKKQLIIIGIVGLLILIIAAFLYYLTNGKGQESTDTFWLLGFLYEAVFSVAFVLVGVFIANIVWNLVGGDPNEMYWEKLLHSDSLLSDSMKCGLIGLCSSSSNMGTSLDWLNFIAKAKERIYIQGYTLLVWTRSSEFSETLLKLAHKGVDIRFILMDENAEHLDAGINEDNITELSVDSVKQEIKDMTTVLNNVIQKYNQQKSPHKGHIKYIKVKKNLITSQIVISDDEIYVTPYMTFFNTSHCPLFKIENRTSELYKKYLTEFNTMWISEGDVQNS